MTDKELISELRSIADKRRKGNRFDSLEYAAADRIEELEAKLAKAVAALLECQEELDQYSKQEYPLDHSVHERYRERDFDANPARIALAEIKGE